MNRYHGSNWSASSKWVWAAFTDKDSLQSTENLNVGLHQLVACWKQCFQKDTYTFYCFCLSHLACNFISSNNRFNICQVIVHSKASSHMLSSDRRCLAFSSSFITFGAQSRMNVALVKFSKHPASLCFTPFPFSFVENIAALPNMPLLVLGLEISSLQLSVS